MLQISMSSLPPNDLRRWILKLLPLLLLLLKGLGLQQVIRGQVLHKKISLSEEIVFDWGYNNYAGE